jgi:hypothetical protein
MFVVSDHVCALNHASCKRASMSETGAWSLNKTFFVDIESVDQSDASSDQILKHGNLPSSSDFPVQD